MTHKRVLFESAAREKILRGVNALADATMTEVSDEPAQRPPAPGYGAEGDV